jgi:hypothetical protein
MKRKQGIAACAVLFVVAGWTARAGVVDFEDIALPGIDTRWNGSDGTAGFTSRTVTFNNTYTDYGGGVESWAGFSYSNVNAPETASYTNQYAAYQPGTGRGGQGNYAVAYYAEASFFSPEFKPRLTLSAPAEVRELYVNNTAYTALSIRDGDGFTDAFGSNDWFRLRIAALDEALQSLGPDREVYLADYRDGKTFIQADWVRVDLSAFGSAVKHLEFRIDGSRVGDFGLTTPAYFALDDIHVVPEPRAAGLLAAAGAILSFVRRRRAA